MSHISSTRTRRVARIAAPFLLASVLGACSSISDWVDPTGWFGSDSQASSEQSGGTADATQMPDSGKTPDLASIPPKPAAPSTPDEQQEVANSLTADRAQAQYSAEALQGGTEPVAAPPPPESTPADQSSSAAAAPAALSQTNNAASSSVTASSGDSSTPAAADAASQTTASTDSSPTQVASTEAPETAAPAATPMAAAMPSARSATDMQTGFAPSRAPALDASVTQYVPQRILSRYQQTAAAAAVPGVEGMAANTAAKPARRRKARAIQTEPGTIAPAQ